MKSFRGFTFSIKNPLFNIPKIKYYIFKITYRIPYDISTIPYDIYIYTIHSLLPKLNITQNKNSKSFYSKMKSSRRY